MTKLTNNHDMPLLMSVWAVHDEYDHDTSGAKNLISATTLLKPIKEIILSMRVPAGSVSADVGSRVAARLGTDIHNGVENAWLYNYRESLKLLGYPVKVINSISINPEKPTEGIDVYFEQRSKKEINGFILSGKFDAVLDGTVNDVKKTGTYTYVKNNKDADYCLQGSMYKWLNQEIITSDHILINFVFLDWKAFEVAINPAYPKHQIVGKKIPLKSITETENFIIDKTDQIKKYLDAPENVIPQCNDKDLWRDPPKFKYYKNPLKLARSTKNYDDYYQASLHLQKDGNVGIVKEVKGTAKACKYCAAVTVCEQAKSYILGGELTL